MDNAEEVLQFLEEFSKRKPKSIPPELDDYLAYVARTGDPVFQWTLVKSLFKEKLMNVISDFNETSPGMDIPPYPNVDPFNYETMKESLLERLDSFVAAPFTVQRICELLMYPRKQYNRIDKFMRAIEKNILVVSTREPGALSHHELENGDQGEPMVNGSESSDYTVDVEMEDMSWKEKGEQNHIREPQPSSSDVPVDNIEVRLKSKQDSPKKSKEKVTEYESEIAPEISVSDEPPTKVIKSESDKRLSESKEEKDPCDEKKSTESENKMETEPSAEPKDKSAVPISETVASDVDMPEDEERAMEKLPSSSSETTKKPEEIENKTKEVNVMKKDEVIDKIEENQESPPEKQVDSINIKMSCDIEELSESSSENSSSSEGNTNSPKTDQETVVDVNEESKEAESDTTEESSSSEEKIEENGASDVKEDGLAEAKPGTDTEASSNEDAKKVSVQTSTQEEYSITDVKSELPVAPEEKSIKETSAAEPAIPEPKVEKDENSDSNG